MIGVEQLEWLANDLAHVPEDKLIVLATRIPLVSFIDMYSTKHQTDDATALYALLEGRPALSLSGHAQTIENLAPGDSYEGWPEAVGVNRLPFPHIVAGAVSGSWWTGDLTTNGIPNALQREGAPAGYLNLDFDGTAYQDSYRATDFPEDQQMALSVSSPYFRDWYETLTTWQEDQEAPTSSEPPPVNVNDLGDPNLVTVDDLAGGTSYLVANVWNGSSDWLAGAHIDDRSPVRLARTQRARGEGIREGAEFADPFAVIRQLQVARYAFESTSGDERAQGSEAFRGSRFGPGPEVLRDAGVRGRRGAAAHVLPYRAVRGAIRRRVDGGAQHAHRGRRVRPATPVARSSRSGTLTPTAGSARGRRRVVQLP